MKYKLRLIDTVEGDTLGLERDDLARAFTDLIKEKMVAAEVIRYLSMSDDEYYGVKKTY
jgi:hypothetical protein